MSPVPSPTPSAIPCRLHPVYLSDTLEALAGRVAACAPRAVVCTEEKLARLLAPQIRAFQVGLRNAPVLTFPGGERHKTRRTKERLEDALFGLGVDRGTTLVSVGGGVVSDMVGFVAATTMRGIPWVAVPTTLLAMVDAALGGKTAVDTPFGKNTIGSFYPPQGVFIALDFLDTLPRKALRCGLAECLKHGLSMEAGYFEWLQTIDFKRLRRDRRAQWELVEKSATLKCSVIDEDPEETSGRRNILNAGHTVGHALERLSRYRMDHGEAVAAGLLWEAGVATAQGHLRPSDLKAVAVSLNRLGFTREWRLSDPSSAVFAAAGADKKNRGGKVAYVPLKGIGEVAFPPPHTAELSLEDLAAGLRLVGE